MNHLFYFYKTNKVKIIDELDEIDLQIFNKELLLSKNFKFWDSNNDPDMNLFYWCIFSKRLEIAKLLWKQRKVEKLFI